MCDKDPPRGGRETRRRQRSRRGRGKQVGKHARPRLALDTARARFDPIVVSDRHRPAPGPEEDLVTLRARPWKLAPPSVQSIHDAKLTNDYRKERASVRRDIEAIFNQSI